MMLTVGSWFWVLLVWGGLVVCPFGVIRFGGFASWLLRCWIVSDSAELSICLLVDRFGLVGLVVGLTWGCFWCCCFGLYYFGVLLRPFLLCWLCFVWIWLFNLVLFSFV